MGASACEVRIIGAARAFRFAPDTLVNMAAAAGLRVERRPRKVAGRAIGEQRRNETGVERERGVQAFARFDRPAATGIDAADRIDAPSVSAPLQSAPNRPRYITPPARPPASGTNQNTHS